jgi:hypothetical protein
MSTEIVKSNNPAELMRQATDVAGVTKEIVMKTACNIKGKKYVQVEGWQSIAVAHGCILSSHSVENIEGGIRAIGEVRRIDTGLVIATAEGFVGDDEKTWASRDTYAKRAMAQTRAMSRAARSAFAHVVVMIDQDLSTTPAEEVPSEGFENREKAPEVSKEKEPAFGRKGFISESQGKRLWAIAKEAGLSKEIVKDYLSKKGIDHTCDIKWQAYEQICKDIEQMNPKQEEPEPQNSNEDIDWETEPVKTAK